MTMTEHKPGIEFITLKDALISTVIYDKYDKDNQALNEKIVDCKRIGGYLFDIQPGFSTGNAMIFNGISLKNINRSLKGIQKSWQP